MLSVTVPSASSWSPARSTTTSPSTSSRAPTCCSVPSRSARAWGATRSAIRSSVRLARTSWVIPMAVFEIRMAPNSASAGLPAARIRIRNTSRIRLNSVSVFERTMLAYDRLDAGGSRGPIACRRAAASAWVRPAAAGAFWTVPVILCVAP